MLNSYGPPMSAVGEQHNFLVKIRTANKSAV